MRGDLGTAKAVTFRSKEKILFQKPRNQGQCHQIWSKSPQWTHPLKHRREAPGKIWAKREGTIYQEVRSLTLASTKETLMIPLNEKVLMPGFRVPIKRQVLFPC